MSARLELVQFVRDALAAGRSRAEIRGALSTAGWRDRDVDRALSAYADVGFTPPVPRPRPFASARDAVMYGLGFFALAVVLVNGVAALFDLVESAAGEGRPWSASAQAWRIAAIAVFAPLFAYIDLRADLENPVRKVLAYAALFFAALVLLFTLVGVIALGLTGGLGTEVTLKALILAVAACAVLVYYRRDLRADTER
ncbi:DUF5671 domain-containing protein [Palleronia rufa]|uniref:DUF5671 domain-containing protein n=1 Tax=Palleronia rufa TaxID=1530186 RepID=UPI000690CCF8|nr:DUF5671 domain-containing protein [Palleronia rufa]